MNTQTATLPTASLLPLITIGAFKYFAAMSQETNAFTANVLLDGKLVGYADNEGRGGSTHIRFVGDDRHDLEVHRAAFEEKVDTLVDEAIHLKALGKTILKIRKMARETTAFVCVECLKTKGQYRNFKKGATVNLNAVTQKVGFVKFVADMTDAEILAHFVEQS